MITNRLLSLFALVGAAVAWVDVDPDLIPALDEPLPVFSLGEPSFIPDDWLESVVGHTGKKPKFVKRSSDDPKVYIYDGDEVVGFVDKSTGETRVFPDYGTLKPCDKPVDINKALSLFEKGSDAFPADDTGIELTRGSSLQGGEVADAPPTEGSGSNYRRWNDTVIPPAASPDLTYLTLGTVTRSVKVGDQTFPVCGPGSQASFGVGPENKVVSLSYQWKPATKTNKLQHALPAGHIAEYIQAALEPKVVLTQAEGIKVYHVDTCFYDSGVSYLQPVYRVLAEPYDHTNTTADDRKKFVEYIPIDGDGAETIPSGEGTANVAGGASPDEPSTSDNTRRSFLNYFEARQGLTAPTITVGRYVVRNDSDGFVEDARNFWTSLSTSPTYNFVNSQYYWAFDWLYKENAQSFVNSVDLALTEAHGGFHRFSTYKGSAAEKDGGVHIPADLPTDGFGPISNSGKGKLSYWFIDACEVIPSSFDFQAIDDPNPQRRAFDPWWPVFRGGIHAVVGWRTSALFSDNTASRTAAAIALGRPVVSAWLDAAHTDPAYKNKPTYTGGGTGIEDWPLGRAAAVFRCGRASDKVVDRQNLGAPTCLSIRYWNND
ncbi:hypothetical protein FA13DRAFT_1401431 [Coprinellus micaceus]|uniref:Uncharacterized protein n=1 Tax=Coprinellus micaceus TaxID=71717 RepID=A0A4Y7SPG3_COPMI|nr:hypothetical protein FA13DRAFT_1401431 [Coprinellus micaceus]